ncbi:MAG: hypothetical protein QXU82_02615 [Candidatus Aenigmatarchaeota archaeon]
MNSSAQAFQTATVMILFIIIGAVVYLVWSFSSKLFGSLLVIMGALILMYFPDISDYQAKSFTIAGRVIGVLLLLLGILIFVLT